MKYCQKILLNGIKRKLKTKKLFVTVTMCCGQRKILMQYLKILLKIIIYATIS